MAWVYRCTCHDLISIPAGLPWWSMKWLSGYVQLKLWQQELRPGHDKLLKSVAARDLHLLRDFETTRGCVLPREKSPGADIMACQSVPGPVAAIIPVAIYHSTGNSLTTTQHALRHLEHDGDGTISKCDKRRFGHQIVGSTSRAWLYDWINSIPKIWSYTVLIRARLGVCSTFLYCSLCRYCVGGLSSVLIDIRARSH